LSTESRLSDRLGLSLFIAQMIAAATLIRSVAFDRWITVFASILLLTGTFAAQRGKTWGVGLSLATAAAFPVASMIGIAPPWFWLVGIAGALPFILASRAFARFDRGATILLAALALIGGSLGAMGWKEYALDVFRTFPALMPSIRPHHGLLTMMLAVGFVIAFRPGRSLFGGGGAGKKEEEARVRVDTQHEHLRVSTIEESDFEIEEAPPAAAAKKATSGSSAQGR